MLCDVDCILISLCLSLRCSMGCTIWKHCEVVQIWIYQAINHRPFFLSVVTFDGSLGMYHERMIGCAFMWMHPTELFRYFDWFASTMVYIAIYHKMKNGRTTLRSYYLICCAYRLMRCIAPKYLFNRIWLCCWSTDEYISNLFLCWKHRSLYHAGICILLMHHIAISLNASLSEHLIGCIAWVGSIALCIVLMVVLWVFCWFNWWYTPHGNIICVL